jgi:hypothetical protein
MDRCMRMFLAMILAVILSLAATSAGRADDMADFNKALDAFLAEQRVFLNCSALDAMTYTLAAGNFQDMVDATRDLIRTYGTPADLARFQEKTAVGSLIMRDRPFGEIIALCAKNKDWQDRFINLKFIVLQNEASRIFYSRHRPK